MSELGRPRFTPALRADLAAKSEGKCSYCDSELEWMGRWDVDHVFPRGRGGSSDVTNLVASCAYCNCSILADLPKHIRFYEKISNNMLNRDSDVRRAC